MKKTYQSPRLRVTQITANAMLITSLNQYNDSKANIGNGAEAWSKSFWGTTFDDDATSSASTSTFHEDE